MSSRGLILGVALLAGLLAWWFGSRGDVVAPLPHEASPGDGARSASESSAPDPVVPGAASDYDRTEPSSSDDKGTTGYRTLGVLSPMGREALLATLSDAIEEAEKLVESRLEVPDGADRDLSEYVQDLDAVQRLALLRARREVVSKGLYMTVPLTGNTGGSAPRAPSGFVEATYGAFQVEGGEFAQVLIWVDEERISMKHASASLARTLAAERADWIARFNSASESERRSWFVRFDSLSKKAAQGVTEMSADEIADCIVINGEVRHLRLSLNRENLTVY